MKNLSEAETKAQDFCASEQRLSTFLNDAIHFKQKLEGDIFVLKDDLVETYDIYFKCGKKHMPFLIMRWI